MTRRRFPLVDSLIGTPSTGPRLGAAALLPHGVVIELFADEACTTPLDATDLDGNPIEFVVVDGVTIPRFLGPESDDVTVYGRPEGDTGPGFPMQAVDTLELPPRLAKDELEAAFAGLPDARPVVSVNSPLWVPPVQPPMSSVSNMTAAEMLTEWWEPLRDDDYVTRTQIGTDQSGTYPIWRYDFAPPHYDRTVVVTANMHGGEKMGAFNAARLMHYVVNEWRTHPWLSWLRWNVRIVVVPSVNPWGASDLTGPRTNSRGVDINRNWDYRWAEYVVPSPPYEKGSAPFSEAETVAVRDLVLSIPDLVAVIDLHDTGESVSGTPWEYYGYLPDHPLTRAGFVRKVFNVLRKPGETFNIHPSSDPQALNWFASLPGVRAATIEYEQRNVPLSSENTTRALTWYANVIMQAAIDPAATALARPEPFVAEMGFATGASTLTIATGSFVELASLSAEFVTNGPGVMTYTGSLTVGVAPGKVEIRPAISQAAGRAPNFVGLASNERSGQIADAADLINIPFHVSLEVHEDPTTAATWPVKIGLLGRASVAGIYVIRYTGLATFMPAERPNRYRKLTATGRSGAGAMQQTFPI